VLLMNIVNVTTGARYRFSSYEFAQRCFFRWGRTWDWRRSLHLRPGDQVVTPFVIIEARGGRTEWAQLT
jgi:hypothetical protein